MTDEYAPKPRTILAQRLEREIAPKVWGLLGGNGSLRINIDTDVECNGGWHPWGDAEYNTPEGRVQEAQFWISYFVRSTINRLIDAGELEVPDA